MSPGRHIEIQPACGEADPLSIINRCSYSVVKTPRPTGEIAPWQRDVTLTLMSGVVHHDEAPKVHRPSPRERDERVVALVSFPGGPRVEELPVSMAEPRVVQAGEEAIVERGDRCVPRFCRSAS